MHTSLPKTRFKTTTPRPRRFPFSYKPLAAALGVCACVVSVTLLVQGGIWDYALKEAAKDQRALLDREADLLQLRFRARVNDIFFLKRMAETALETGDDLASSPHLCGAFTTMMLASSQYDSIALLDRSGHEIQRYDWNNSGGVTKVPPGGLQDRSGEAFFQETAHAAPNQAVISPLTRKQGEGRPEQPVFHLGGQILDRRGSLRAVLIIDYLANDLLREFREDQDSMPQLMLLNADGFWLKNPEARLEWAFASPARRQECLKIQDPGLWEKVTASKEGWFERGESSIPSAGSIRRTRFSTIVRCECRCGKRNGCTGR